MRGGGGRQHLCKEHGVVHPHAVYSLLVGVEEANILTQDVESAGSVPSVSVLVIPANEA